jgi:hypothetical protein
MDQIKRESFKSGFFVLTAILDHIVTASAQKTGTSGIFSRKNKVAPPLGAAMRRVRDGALERPASNQTHKGRSNTLTEQRNIPKTGFHFSVRCLEQRAL